LIDFPPTFNVITEPSREFRRHFIYHKYFGEVVRKKSGYSLQRTMLVYFLLIGVASLVVGVEFIADTNRPELRAELLNNFQEYTTSQIPVAEVFRPIDKIRNKAILMISIIMFVIIIVLTMFTKNITEPLQHMIEIAKKLATGDLRQTVEINSGNELSELSNVINDLSSNLQETTMLARNVCMTGTVSLDEAIEKLSKTKLDPEDLDKISADLTQLRDELGSLEELVSCFHFYSSEK